MTDESTPKGPQRRGRRRRRPGQRPDLRNDPLPEQRPDARTNLGAEPRADLRTGPRIEPRILRRTDEPSDTSTDLDAEPLFDGRSDGNVDEGSDRNFDFDRDERSDQISDERPRGHANDRSDDRDDYRSDERDERDHEQENNRPDGRPDGRSAERNDFRNDALDDRDDIRRGETDRERNSVERHSIEQSPLEHSEVDGNRARPAPFSPRAPMERRPDQRPPRDQRPSRDERRDQRRDQRNSQRPHREPRPDRPDRPAGNNREPRPMGLPDGLEQRCIRQFARGVLIRGRQYFRLGHVSDPTQMGGAFSLIVDGSGERYNIWIDFSQASVDGSLQARCTCPYYETAGLCKHLWASIIKLEQSGFSSKVPGTGPLKILREGPPLPARKAGHPARLPQARIGQMRPMSISLHSWTERMDQIQGKRDRVVTDSIGRMLAAFVIHSAETASTGKLVLDFWSRRKGTGHDTGPLRPDRAPERELRVLNDPRDQEMVSLLLRTGEPKLATSFGGSCTRFTVDPILETQVLTTIAGAGKAFLSRSPNGSPDNADRPLRMDRGKPWDTELELEAVAGSRFRLTATLKRDQETRSLNEPVFILSSGLFLLGEQICRLTESRHALWLKNLRTGEFVVPANEVDKLLERILTDGSAPPVTWPEGLGWKRTAISPTPKCAFLPLGGDRSNGRMSATVSFDYAGQTLSLSDQTQSIVDVDNRHVYPRNSEFEEASLNQALEILRDPTGAIPIADLQRSATALSQSGWTVSIENQRVIAADDFSLNVTSSTDWFDLTLEASFDGHPLRKAEILAALDAKSSFVKLKDGSIGFLPEDWISRYATLKRLGNRDENGSLRFDKSQGLLLNAALGEDEAVRGDKGFKTFRKRIAKYDLTEIAKTPIGFKGKLRSYQKEGLTWLGFLKEFESGGILADDMGLGKTIQLLAFLLSRKKETTLPSLVVAPKSLVFNWIDEAQKFAPSLKVIEYVEGHRGKVFHEIGDADLVVTTYGTLRADIEKLRNIEFDVAIVDEAQAIKNPKSQSAIACKQIRAVHRLALTGTPIENSIQDLLSILEFTNPGLLRFSANEDLSRDVESALARLLKPFMLRRTKEAVLTELPSKSEQVLSCEMGVEQAEYYAVLRDRYRESIARSVTTNGLAKSKLHVLEALLRLRQAACHPGLVEDSRRSEPSAKLDRLLTQLKEVLAEGHKALVFSQFTSLLSIVKDKLDGEKIAYEYLDGQTTDRKTPVERFQSAGGSPVFLISLKAGGTGLNLTAADYVFILDPWWNPAVEAQAIGRAHRMGQQQKVFAYRMVARGTVEEKILELQTKKKALAESIVSEDSDFMKKLTKADLENLLAP